MSRVPCVARDDGSAYKGCTTPIFRLLNILRRVAAQSHWPVARLITQVLCAAKELSGLPKSLTVYYAAWVGILDQSGSAAQ